MRYVPSQRFEVKLTASDTAARRGEFGYSVAISGSIAIVGAHVGRPAYDLYGSAYLFDATTGTELFELTASDAVAGDSFGQSVAISGNTAIVGASRNDEGGKDSGSAYLFDVTTGNQLFKLTASDAAAGDFFGQSVAISGNTAIVGARGYDDDSGSAYLFDVTTGNQLFKLTASGAVAGDTFGLSVAISGNTAIVGATGFYDDGDSGSAYLFDVTTGNQVFKLTVSDTGEDDVGFAVAISVNTAIVGASGDHFGSAYLFDVTTGNQLFKLTAPQSVPDLFGLSVAISGNTAVVGAHGDNNDSGSAYLFDVTTGNQLFKLTASDTAEYDRFGHSVAISGNMVIVGAKNDDDGGSSSGSAYVFTTEP